jgi:UDPglucose--hexose-1-phosphate uridylyltransferase
MSELRKDPVTNRWVIISAERGMRPSDFELSTGEKKSGFCPFCYNNESKTPPEIFAYRPFNSSPNTSGWLVRVVSNKFPALRIEGKLNRAGEGMYDMMNGIGAHEVIIETPEHEATFGTMDDQFILYTIQTYQDRMLDLQKDKRLRYMLIFKNYGEAAGASLHHPHSQLIATPIVPKRVQEELNGASQYFEYKERCVFCDMIRQELDDGRRLVIENSDFISFAPFAARFPYETWLLPKEHNSNFESYPRHKLAELAQILKDTIRLIEKSLSCPPYNFVLHTSPCNQLNLAHYHWHLEIMPKLTKVAGFEWGSGFYINPTPPELAAQYLRDANKKEGA